MSFQWTFIAGYLYFEIAFVMLMIFPLFTPRKWYAFYRLFGIFHHKTAIYFYSWLGILCLFLFDAIREMRKYSYTNEAGHIHLASEMERSEKLFGAQRNFYITGFAIFLAFVIRRLIIMIITQHALNVNAQQLIKKTKEAVNLEAQQIIKAEEAVNLFNIAVMLLKAEREEIKNRLELTESLDVQKVKELEEEAMLWRLKYEEVTRYSIPWGKHQLSFKEN